MKIKNTRLEIIKGDINILAVDAIVDCHNRALKTEVEKVSPSRKIPPGLKYIIYAVVADKNLTTNESILRRACARALECAEKLKLKSIGMPALGSDIAGFPIVGSAKIMTQEVLKHAKFSKQPIEEIIFCLSDEKIFQTFQQTVIGYVTHIQDTLGDGPYVTVDAIIELKEGIILIERSNPPYGWALPGGFVDYGESLEEAVIREAREETNIKLKNLRQFHAFSDPKRDPRFHTVSTVFIAEGEGRPKFGDDAKGLKVIAYQDLLKLDYAFDHKQIIKDYLKSKKVSKPS